MKGGKSKGVRVASEPAGAQVYIDGSLAGTTPCRLDLALKKAHLLEFRKEGYEKQTVLVSNKLGTGWVAADSFLGFLALTLGALFVYAASIEGEETGGVIASVGVIGLGTIPLVVDAKTGAWNSFDRKEVTVSLDKKP